MEDSQYGSDMFIAEDESFDTTESPRIKNQQISIVPKFIQNTTTLADFEIKRKLGEGSYSTVYKVIRKKDGKVYSLKKVRIIEGLSDKERENSVNEVRILASITNNPNVVRYYEAFMDQYADSNLEGPGSPYLCIVMEYADGGDLFQKIQEFQKHNKQFTEKSIWKIIIQTINGLKALHDLNIMHRDLKSANVFLNQDQTVKLGDMNVSKVANQQGLNFTQTGTPYYASPEVWRDEKYDFKSDIWSLGCVIYELITFKPPFQAEDMQGLFKQVNKGVYPKIKSSYSQDLAFLISIMLQVNANKRPSCYDLLSMPMIQLRAKNMCPEIYLELQQNTGHQDKLLKTIYVPKYHGNNSPTHDDTGKIDNFVRYIQRKLPQANYEENEFPRTDSRLQKSLPTGALTPNNKIPQKRRGQQQKQNSQVKNLKQPNIGISAIITTSARGNIGSEIPQAVTLDQSLDDLSINTNSTKNMESMNHSLEQEAATSDFIQNGAQKEKQKQIVSTKNNKIMIEMQRQNQKHRQPYPNEAENAIEKQIAHRNQNKKSLNLNNNKISLYNPASKVWQANAKSNLKVENPESQRILSMESSPKRNLNKMNLQNIELSQPKPKKHKKVSDFARYQNSYVNKMEIVGQSNLGINQKLHSYDRSRKSIQKEFEIYQNSNQNRNQSRNHPLQSYSHANLINAEKLVPGRKYLLPAVSQQQLQETYGDALIQKPVRGPKMKAIQPYNYSQHHNYKGSNSGSSKNKEFNPRSKSIQRIQTIQRNAVSLPRINSSVTLAPYELQPMKSRVVGRNENLMKKIQLIKIEKSMENLGHGAYSELGVGINTSSQSDGKRKNELSIQNIQYQNRKYDEIINLQRNQNKSQMKANVVVDFSSQKNSVSLARDRSYGNIICKSSQRRNYPIGYTMSKHEEVDYPQPQIKYQKKQIQRNNRGY